MMFTGTEQMVATEDNPPAKNLSAFIKKSPGTPGDFGV